MVAGAVCWKARADGEEAVAADFEVLRDESKTAWQCLKISAVSMTQRL